MLGKTVSSLGPSLCSVSTLMPTHAEPAVLVSAIDLIEQGDLGRAGQAPACPENDQNHVAFEVGQVHRLAVEIGSLNRRRRLADHVELVKAAGAEALDGGVVDSLCTS